MIEIRKKSIDKIMWSIFLFILIFNPPIVPHANLFLAAISILVLLAKYRNSINNILKKSEINYWCFGAVILFMYVLIVPFTVSLMLNDIVNISHYVSLFNRFAVLFFTIVPCCTLLISMLDAKGYDYHFFLQTSVTAGLIEGFFVILTFFSPTAKSVFISLMAKNAPSELYHNVWYITVRSYGFAGTLVDLFGLGIAVIAGISFFYGVIYQQRYIIYSILILIGAVLNARTGVVLYLISVPFGIILFFRQRHIRTIFKTIWGIIIILFISIGIFKIVSINAATRGWIWSLVNSIKNTIRTQSMQGAMGKLFNQNYWEMPDIFRAIIGTAHSKYAAEGYSHSDVGYINDIWFCGFIGCCILYGNLIKLLFNIYKNRKNVMFRFCAIHLMLCFFIFNVKACAYGYNPGMAAILTIVFTLNYYVMKDKQNNLF